MKASHRVRCPPIESRLVYLCSNQYPTRILCQIYFWHFGNHFSQFVKETCEKRVRLNLIVRVIQIKSLFILVLTCV
ncbi:unnamed protein product [Callosobruchus maculatus]|uniref:Uncharacterized protein n=1 Tax=Callosobruchus maculatus TaxID=64391 RepID=A0A653C9T6_CALMS|nr:unnamed protein product [Callosobruchus maculatus]